MKLACISVCFLFLLVRNDCSVFPPDFFYERPDFEGTVSEDSDEEDPSVVDYPSFFIDNPEENEIKTDEDKTKQESESPEVVTEVQPLSDYESDVNVDVTSIENKVDKLLADFKTQQDKISKLEETNKKLVLKIDSIEQQIKTNSIILTNVHQKPDESSKVTLQKVLHVFNRVMKVRTSANDIAVALRAESNSSGKNKPIVVRFTNFATKMKVLSASNRLSHTDMTVSSDYSELVAQRRAALLPYLQQARTEGRRAFMLYDRLIIDGESYTLEELQAGPGIEGANAARELKVLQQTELI